MSNWQKLKTRRMHLLPVTRGGSSRSSGSTIVQLRWNSVSNAVAVVVPKTDLFLTLQQCIEFIRHQLSIEETGMHRSWTKYCWNLETTHSWLNDIKKSQTRWKKRHWLVWLLQNAEEVCEWPLFLCSNIYMLLCVRSEYILWLIIFCCLLPVVVVS